MSNWFRVEVSDHEGQIVAIETEMLAGRDIGEVERSVICKAIDHLSGFLGLPNAAAEVERLNEEMIVVKGANASLRLSLHGCSAAHDEAETRAESAERQRDEATKRADEAIAALRAIREPTEEMVRAGAVGICNDARGCEGQYRDDDSVWSTWQRDARAAYKAMLDAAPASARRLLNQKEGT